MPMMKLPVNNLIGGVSQQPPANRNGDQVELAFNTLFSPVEGATKRPPTLHLNRIVDTSAFAPGVTGANWKYHFINRSPAERYWLCIKDTTPPQVKAFDAATGAPRIVRDIPGDAYAYLVGATPITDVELTTVADYTFVLNRLRTTAMDTSVVTADTNLGHGFVFVRQGNYSTQYSIRVKTAGVDQTYTFKTWDGTNLGAGSATPTFPLAGPLGSIRTDDIAEQLRLGINAMAGATWAATRSGSVVRILDATHPFTLIESTDSVGDSVIVTVNRTAPRVSGHLPDICDNGYRVKITGSAEVDQDDYWVKFVTDLTGSTFGHGQWQEDLDYGAHYKFSAVTMPHILVRMFDDAFGTVTGTAFQAYFDWKRGTWTDKIVGDDTSIPNPSFIGKTINDIYHYKERLGFLADDRVVMSETGAPFNFWRNTLLVLEDTAPIDITVNYNPVALLKQAVVDSHGDLMLKATPTWFTLKGGDVLSPRTVQVVPMGAYESIEGVRPIASGRSIFFPFHRGGASGIREFFESGEQVDFEQIDVTLQVPNYITGNAQLLAASPLEETLVVKAGTSENTIYVYRYLWVGSQKLLSSWNKWFLCDTALVRGMAFTESLLHLVVEYPQAGVHLETIDLALGAVDTGATYTTLTDRRVDQAALSSRVYAVPNTTIILPYVITGSATVQVTEKLTGTTATIVSHAGNSVVISGDWSARNFWVGLQYTQQIDLSQPIYKVTAGRGQAPTSGSRDCIKCLDLEYSNSRPFQVEVYIDKRSAYLYTFAATPPWGETSPLDGAAAFIVRTGIANVPIRGRARELTCRVLNDTPFQARLTSAVWTLQFWDNGARA